MREAIGATWIFGIVLTFIMLFTAYLAISVNYAKAFKIKSHIVSMIEEREGNIDDGFTTEVTNYLIAQGYSATGNCTGNEYGTLENGNWTRINENDFNVGLNKSYICLYKSDPISNAADGIGDKTYYKVITFFKFDIPMLGNMLTFKIKGETKLIYDFGGSAEPAPL